MLRARVTSRELPTRGARSSVATLLRETTLPATQIRTCSSCGRHTTFVLEDSAGGWYICRDCGRYA
jgi:ribosomal protein S14